MRLRRYIVGTAFLLASAPTVVFGQTGKVPEGFVSIFNGKNLKGWHVSRTDHHGSTGNFYVEDGAIVLKQRPYGQGGLLFTDKKYKDFELYVEAKPDWGCNGGIFFRSTEGGSGYQIEIDQGRGTGNLIGELMRLSKSARATDVGKVWKYDDWNSFRLRAVGEAPHITLWINGVQMWDVTEDQNDKIADEADGMIGLQLHWSSLYTPAGGLMSGSWKPGAAHRFRNIAIKELK